MSGTVRGTVDIATNLANEYQETADIFKAMFDAFEAHPNTTRIALQWGNGGTGTDRWDGANPFGENAFAVWRMEAAGSRTWPYYFTMHCSCADGTSATWGAAPGDPVESEQSTASSTAYLGFQCAIGIGGDENPWNGTTANDGTDSRGGSAAFAAGADGGGAVWRVPAAGGTELLVFPRSNNNGGTYDTVKEDMCVLINQGSNNSPRAHLVMDDDIVCMYWDSTDAGAALSTFLFFGTFDPHINISPAYDRPFVQWASRGAFYETVVTERSGGLTTPDSTDVSPVVRPQLKAREFMAASFQPNGIIVPASYDYAPWDVLCGSDSREGFAGTTPAIFQHCFNLPRNSSNAAKTLGVLGTATVGALKAVLPWTGVAAPGATSTREGTTF